RDEKVQRVVHVNAINSKGRLWRDRSVQKHDSVPCRTTREPNLENSRYCCNRRTSGIVLWIDEDSENGILASDEPNGIVGSRGRRIQLGTEKLDSLVVF